MTDDLTRDDLIDRCIMPARIAEKQADELLNRRVDSCSVTWAKEMCKRFQLADGYHTEFHNARDAIREVQQAVDNA